MRVTRHARRLTLASLTSLFAALPAAAQHPAVRAPLTFDSSTVRALLADAYTSALAAPSDIRGALVSAIGRVQVSVRDFAGAERTMARMEDTSASEIARAFGQPPIYASLDRAELGSRLVCGLRAAGRPDDATVAMLRRPPGDERDWSLAHVASVTARSPSGGAGGIHRDDARRRWTAALELARQLSLPEARLDALVAVAEAAADSATGRAVARQAYDDARRIHLADPDRQSSRNAMLASLAIAIGPMSDVRLLYASLTRTQDLLDVVGTAAASSDPRLVRELAPRAIDAASAIRDPAARRAALSALRDNLVRGVGNATADRLLPVRLVGSVAPDRGRTALDSAVAASTQPRDAAQRALTRGDYAGVRRQVERLPLTDRSARRARLWSDLAWGVYATHRDTARVYLTLAHDALVRAGADSATIDDVGAQIADRQFTIADDDGGIASLNLVRDSDVGDVVVQRGGGSTFATLTADRLRAYAERVRDPNVRDAVLLRVVDGYLAMHGATETNLSRARHLADSITTPVFAARARVSVANLELQRGDTAGARDELAALLTDAPRGSDVTRAIIAPLAAAGGTAQIIAWAHDGTASIRAQRLVQVAEVFHNTLETRAGRRGIAFSNAPDACLDVF